MADVRSSRRLGATRQRIQKTALENKRLSKLVADIPFNKIIVLQEIWERQQRAIPLHQLSHSEDRR
jgi:hypothetical protein